MTDKRKECLEAAKKAFTKFTDEELEDYVNEVFNEAKKYDELGGMSSITRAINEVNNSKIQGLLENSMVTMNNGLKFNELANGIKSKKITLKDTIVKTRNEVNLSNNIQAAQEYARKRFRDEFFKKISKEEEKYFLTDAGELDVAKARSGLPASDMAKKIGSLLDNLEQVIKDEMLSSNAMRLSEMSKNHKILVVHDASKLVNPDKKWFGKVDINYAKNAWIEYIKTKIDMHATFKKVGMVDSIGHIETLNMEKIDRELSKIYDNIVNGRGEIFTKSEVLNDFKAVERKKNMFFIWKDDLSWHEYNKKYGTGSYHDAVYNGINKAANRVGSARIYGDSAPNMLLNLEKVQYDHNYQDKAWFNHAEKLFKYINKIDQSAINPRRATFSGNMIGISGMAKNGKILIAGLDDVSSFAAYAQRFGGGWVETFFNSIGNLFNNKLFGAAEKQHIAEMMATDLDSHVGYISRLVENDSIGGFVSKAGEVFYRIVLNNLKDKGQKVAAMHSFAKTAYKNSNAGWDGLNPMFRSYLEKFNFSKEEWDVLRKKNKGKIFTMDNAEDLTNEELKALYPNSAKSLYELRNDLSRKIYSMFLSVSEASVGTPSEYLKATALNGTRPGTLHGDAWRQFLQFKLFAVQNIDRILIGGLKNADGNAAKFKFILGLTFFTAVMNTASNYLRYHSQGKTYPTFSKLSTPEKMKFIAEHAYGQAGIALSLLDSGRQNQDILSDVLFSSPSLKLESLLMADAISGIMSLTGDKKELETFKRNIKSTVLQGTPIGSLPILEPYAREFMDKKSYLLPGQKQIRGK